MERELINKTLNLSVNQQTKPLVQNKFSAARQEVHQSGVSDMKVKKNNTLERKMHDKKCSVPSKKMTKKMRIELRKKKFGVNQNSLLSAFDAKYQGLFDSKHKVDVDEHTISGFERVLKSVLDKAKEAINSSKHHISMCFKLDGGLVGKILTSVGIFVAIMKFMPSFISGNAFGGFVTGILAFVASIYPWAGDLKDHIAETLIERTTGVKCDMKREASELDEMEIDEYMMYFRNLPKDETWEQVVCKSHKLETEYEGIFDQGLGPFAHAMSSALSGVAGMMTGFWPKSLGGEFFKKLSFTAKMRGDISMIVTESLKVLAQFVDSVAGTDFKSHFKQNAELDKWGTEVAALYELHSQGKLEMVPSNGQRVNALILRGGEIARKHMGMGPGAWAYHRTCTSMLNKMESIFSDQGMPVQERQIPLCVCLRGESGVGKSYITAAFIDQLAMRTLKDERLRAYKENHSREKWLFLPEEDHANGYSGQFCTIIDDMGQFLTQKGQRDDMQQIIRWCNAAPCRLNAAEMEKKGNLVFTSPLIMASTNLYQFWSPSLAKPEAFVRRFDMWIDVVPRNEFCTPKTVGLAAKDRRLDKTKLSSVMEYNACEYRLMRVTDAVNQIFEIDQILTFEEVVACMVEKFNNNKLQHEKLMECLKEERERLYDEFANYEGIINFAKRKFSGAKKAAEEPLKRAGCTLKAAYTKARSAFTSWAETMMTQEFKKKMIKILKITLVVIACVVVAMTAFGWVKKAAGLAFGVLSQTKKSAFSDTLYEAELMTGRGEPLLFGNKLVKSILDRNTYHIYLPGDNPISQESYGTITMLEGRKALINAHYIEQMRTMEKKKPGSFLKLVKHNNINIVYEVPFAWFLSEENTHVDNSRDVAIVQFAANIPVCRSIIDFFADDVLISENRDCDTLLVANRSPLTIHTYSVKDKVMDVPLKIQGNVHENVIVYDADTHSGDCGSLLVYNGDYSATTQRILGIHMAGVKIADTKKGFATILTRAYLNRLLREFEQEPVREFTFVPEGNLLPTKTVHEVVKSLEDKPVFSPSTSAIIKSKIYGKVGEVTKLPACLQTFNVDGVKISPLNKAHEKQNTQNTYIDVKKVKVIKEALIHELSAYVKNTDCILNFEEAVKGAEHLPNLGPIPRQTSAGFSYRSDKRVKSGKKDFFGQDGEYVFDTELAKELETKVDDLVSQLKSGVVPEDRVYQDVLKDETLPIAKVLEGKTRMISACDLPMTVVYRKYFGALCNDLVSTRLFNGMAIGMNPYSNEWELLVKLMGSKGKHCVAGDFSGYDASQVCQLIEVVVDIMSALTGHTDPEDIMAMRALAVTLSQPYHASKKFIYELDHGMPSGNPMTSIMNSIFGLVAFRLAWLECVGSEYVSDAACVADFTRHVTLIMYGDDNILNISAEKIDRFNQHSLMKKFPIFGLKYTSDVKEDLNPPKWRKISEIGFLKRSFIKNEVLCRHVAALDKDTITNMLNYTKKGGSSDSITIDNCNNALREASLHGKKYYEELAKKIQKVLKDEMNYSLRVFSYEDTVLSTAGITPSWIKEHI